MRLLISVCILAILPLTSTAQVIYVDSASTAGTPDGNSWATAFSGLQPALDTAETGDTIWVAEGTYYPSVDSAGLDSNRYNTFFLDKEIVMLGGFAGNETAVGQRDWAASPTLLSGDIGTPGDSGDNCFHVIWLHEVDSGLAIDGFRITGGNANGLFPNSGGGGLYLDGVNGLCRPVIRHSVIAGNAGTIGAGAFLFGNGGISSPVFINCSFYGNAGVSGGAALVLALNGGTCNPSYYHCTIAGNSATNGGSIYNFSLGTADTCQPRMINSIVWGNSTDPLNFGANTQPVYHYSLVESLDGSQGTGNLDGTLRSNDPQFEDPPDHGEAPTQEGNLQLSGCSPAINSGLDSLIPATLMYDLGHDLRIQNAAVDMGAYESPFGEYVNRVFYVDSSATGNDDGTSWADAFTDLQNAVNEACFCDTLWVANGTYYPAADPNGNTNPADEREKTFFLFRDQLIFGGFSGNEDQLVERDWETNTCILSGNLGDPDSPGDNAYHVLLFEGAGSCGRLDGFRITGGYADGTGLKSKGAGIFNDGSRGSSAPFLRNCTIDHNYASDEGGAWYNMAQGGSCQPRMENCNFILNEAGGDGGAIYNFGAGGTVHSELFNCRFLGNSSGDDGGAIYNFEDNFGQVSPVYFNVLFQGNYASDKGGALLNDAREASCTPTLINCSLSGNNSGNFGGAIYNFEDLGATCEPLLINTVCWGNGDEVFDAATSNTLAQYSLIRGVSDTAGLQMLDGTDSLNDPLFVGPPDDQQAPDTSGNLLLMSCSPLQNAGIGDSIPGGQETDLAGNPRIYGGDVDVGAFEIQIDPCDSLLTGPIYVDSTATGMNNGSSWVDAFAELQDALDAAHSGDTIWVARGTYYPKKDSTGNFPPNSIEKTFYLDKDLVLFGGFEGIENNVSERDSILPTVLSGDVGIASDSSDNALHVLYSSGGPDTVVLDGFIVRRGNAALSGKGGTGAALYNRGNFVARNCRFFGNHSEFGSAVYAAGQSFLQFINCTISSNTSNAGSLFEHESGAEVVIDPETSID